MDYRPLWLLVCCGGLAAQTPVDSLISCRQVTSTQERVACYDAAVDALLSESEPDKSFGAPEPPVLQPSVAADPPLDEIVARVTLLTTDARGHWTAQLDNGQTWALTDNDRSLAIVQGDEVLIRRARLGTFRLEKTSGSRSVRVKRLS